MEGVTNGGMLYHEVQESKLCAVHCLNTVLQGPFFSEFDLAALASDLDSKERQVMHGAAGSGDFLSAESHNVSLDGDFSIQVLQKALEVWDMQVIPLNSPVAESAQVDPDVENAFICHLHDHWFCIRKVNGEWYNFNSLYAAPQHLSKFYLAAYLDSLKSSGWSIFLVRGNFPKAFLSSSSGSEASNGYGQWLSPEDAHRITKSCNSTLAPRGNPSQPHSNEFEGLMSDMEDEDLKAAIAASLMDPSGVTSTAEADKKPNPEPQTQPRLQNAEDEDLKAAIAASLMDPSEVASTAEADKNPNPETHTHPRPQNAEDEDLKAAKADSLTGPSEVTSTAEAGQKPSPEPHTQP